MNPIKVDKKATRDLKIERKWEKTILHNKKTRQHFIMHKKKAPSRSYMCTPFARYVSFSHPVPKDQFHSRDASNENKSWQQ